MRSLLPKPVDHVVRYVRHYGVGLALREALPYLSEIVTGREKSAERGEAFDRRYGTDTDGEVWPWELETPNPTADAYFYQALSETEVRRAIATVISPLCERTFVDLGSGKGRALLVASTAPFKRVIGVEIAPDLHAVAVQNIATFGARARVHVEAEAVCTDATTFDLPADPLLIFLYNPFGAKTMATVVERLECSLNRHPRPVTVVYVNPLFAKAWRASTAFRVVEDTKSRLVLQARGNGAVTAQDFIGRKI